MPNIIVGSSDPSVTLSGKHYDYDYPNDLNLKPGSELHEKIKTEVLARARESRNKISKRFDSWNEIDKVLTAYIDTDVEEEKIKEEDPRKPVSIVFPYSYAVMETLLTYLVMAFFQDPIFRYEGASPEDTIGAILLEKVIELQCNKMKTALPLHTMFRDFTSYGMGIVGPSWERKLGTKTVESKQGFFSTMFNRNVIGESRRTKEENVVLFEGNTLENIDPYMYLPDPNVSVHDVQKGEYVGWVDTSNYPRMKMEEHMDPKNVFNVKYVYHVTNKRSIFADKKSERTRRTEGASSEDSGAKQVSKPIDTINMYVDLIPKEWKISTSDTPERWLFALTSDSVVTRAQPLGLDHNMYPIAVGAPDFDGYSVTPLSRMEILSGLQETLTWLFNSHIANVRKAINDMLVVDPYLVNINDLKDPKPGKLIRMRRPAWGRGVEKAVQQLAVQDITRANIADSQFIVQWMQKIGAADDAMMGSLRQGGPERLTGKEFQGTRVGAVSRLERVARVVGLQGMQDIGYMFAVTLSR